MRRGNVWKDEGDLGGMELPLRPLHSLKKTGAAGAALLPGCIPSYHKFVDRITGWSYALGLLPIFSFSNTSNTVSGRAGRFMQSRNRCK